MRRSLNKELDQCWNQLPLAKVKSFEITNTFSDNTLRNLIADYNNAESSKSRKEILTIFAQNFKRKQLKDLIPGLTDFCTKEAMRHCKEHGPGTAVPTAPVHRFFFSEDKVDHFLRFITSDMISQDTAYSTSKLKLESGEN